MAFIQGNEAAKGSVEHTEQATVITLPADDVPAPVTASAPVRQPEVRKSAPEHIHRYTELRKSKVPIYDRRPDRSGAIVGHDIIIQLACREHPDKRTAVDIRRVLL